MKKYALKEDPNKVFTEDYVIGRWADGSDMTIEEAFKTKHSDSSQYLLVSDFKGARVAEIFDLATKFALAFASAGIKPNVKDCFETAAEMYLTKDNL